MKQLQPVRSYVGDGACTLSTSQTHTHTHTKKNTTHDAMTTPTNGTHWDWKQPPDAETATVLGLGLVSLLLGAVHHQ